MREWMLERWDVLEADGEGEDVWSEAALLRGIFMSRLPRCCYRG